VLASLILAIVADARASTYVVYIPLDSPIYDQLDTLDGLGYLDDYLSEVRPISRVEAARLTREAERNVDDSERKDPLAREMVSSLDAQLAEEIGWLRANREDDLPTMAQPVSRVEGQGIFSSGGSRHWNTGRSTADLQAVEDTPLLPNNDGLPTGPGTNEVVRWSGWAGFGSFLTGYGEGAGAGPVTRDLSNMDRLRPLGAEVVLSLGNKAISFGQQEMWWGPGHFAALSQSDNAAPFPALRLQNVHPSLLPWFLKYLGQFRYNIFFGQLDADRYWAHPWLSGQVFAFKPMPNFEFGLDHVIMFGGRYNDFYGLSGFFGRATGFDTGSPSVGQTHSRGGIWLRIRFPKLRGLLVYQEMLGVDNLTSQVPGIGRFLPFVAVSYQGGFYLPYLTRDGRTDLRFEYTILEPNYASHGDSLYWTNNSYMMGDPLGPNASEIDLAVGRWLRNDLKLTSDLFVTDRAPTIGTNSPYPASLYGPNLVKERSAGVAFDVLKIPAEISKTIPALATAPIPFVGRVSVPALGSAHARVSFEYVDHLNYGNASSFRTMLSLSIGLQPTHDTYTWH
jgi:hypothetical protein